MTPAGPARRRRASLLLPLLAACSLLGGAAAARAQALDPDLIREASRRTGLSPQELARRYEEAQGRAPASADSVTPPGLTALPAQPAQPARAAGTAGGFPAVVLPGVGDPAAFAAAPPADAAAPAPADPARAGFFGDDFFRLEPGVFGPSSFGPVPEDYLIGPGDQVVVDVWGDVEFRLERLVDRDGAIILPKGGRIACWNRTLEQVADAVREALSRSYSGLAAGTTHLSVSLGSLRAIRVFVVGDAVQPGAYELTGVATVFSALYAAGGPSAAGSWRDVRLVRGSETVASVDLYRYLLEGRREGDAILREGDTVFVPPRGATVALRGAVRRPLRFELRPGEGLAELLRFGGGLLASAAAERVHVERVVPASQRRPHEPDRVTSDIPLDPATGGPAAGADAALRDGDVVTVGAIGDRLENWVEVAGNVKRPGRYEWRDGLDAAGLLELAGGPWPDTLPDLAILDRVRADGTPEATDFHLGDVLSGKAPPPALRPRDTLRVFSIWDVREQYRVAITGEVRAPGEFLWREGMTLRDLVLRAGGLTDAADALRAEVSRPRPEALASRDTGAPPAPAVDVLEVPLGPDFLTAPGPFALQPRDRVAIRKLPWWELQRVVTVRGEVMAPGDYSLRGADERLSQVVARAGGLKPSAFVPGARLVRGRDGVGNVAIDLGRALADPGSAHDIVLAAGDALLVPETQNTVTVTGKVGFPTSLVHRRGLSLGDYVNSAGGWADGADKWKTRVVYPNGASKPIRKIWRDPPVLAGSTIVVPEKPPRESRKLETLKDIAQIVASVATVWLVIDRTD